MKLNLLPVAFAVVGVPLTFGLGIWQIQRHLNKIEAHEIVSARMAEPMLSNAALLNDVMDDDGALALNHWKLIELTGHYTEKTALIGGKMEQKQPGYNLLQLFQTDLGTQVIVERGWLPREDINTHFDSAMEGIEAVTLIGQLRPIRFKFEMDPVSAPDFPAPVWRPASQGEIHRRWLPDNPQVIVTAGPVLREHQSKDLTSMPYSGFVPTPAEYNSFFYAIQWFLISAILLGIGISLGVDRSNEETPSA